jgi:hypothetical protein
MFFDVTTRVAAVPLAAATTAATTAAITAFFIRETPFAARLFRAGQPLLTKVRPVSLACHPSS